MSTESQRWRLGMPAIGICMVVIAAAIALYAAVAAPARSSYAQPALNPAVQATPEPPKEKPTEDVTPVPERLSLQPAIQAQNQSAEGQSDNSLLWWIIILLAVVAVAALIPLLMRRSRA